MFFMPYLSIGHAAQCFLRGAFLQVNYGPKNSRGNKHLDVCIMKFFGMHVYCNINTYVYVFLCMRMIFSSKKLPSRSDI